MKSVNISLRPEHSELFSHLSETEFNWLANQSEFMRFDKKEKVYGEEDAANAVYLTVKGTIKIGKTLNDGKELIKYIIQKEDWFGESALFGEMHRRESAVSVRENTQCFRFPVSALDHIMQRNYKFSVAMSTMMHRRLATMENRLGSFISKNARSRIVDFIRHNAETKGRQVGFEILINQKLTHQDIANITGTSRQTVTSVLNDLKRSNLIYFNGMGILVRDLAKLA